MSVIMAIPAHIEHNDTVKAPEVIRIRRKRPQVAPVVEVASKVIKRKKPKVAPVVEPFKEKNDKFFDIYINFLKNVENGEELYDPSFASKGYFISTKSYPIVRTDKSSRFKRFEGRVNGIFITVECHFNYKHTPDSKLKIPEYGIGVTIDPEDNTKYTTKHLLNIGLKVLEFSKKTETSELKGFEILKSVEMPVEKPKLYSLI